MKKVVVLLLLVIVATYAVNKNLMRPQTILPNPDELKTQTSKPAATLSTAQPNNNSDMPLIGRQEVIGYTTYDWQYNGPTYTQCRLDAVANGVHCYWMYSNFNQSVDRNERYNFYDFSTHSWNWADGINIYPIRSGFGAFDNDPITGNGVASTHNTSTGTLGPQIARDLAPGAGLFEYTAATAGWQWPAVGVTYNQAIHIADIDATSTDSLWYTRCQPWNTWTPHIRIPDPGASPQFPDQNIIASKTSNKVVILWQCSEDAYPERAFYKLSTDGGVNWGAQTQIPYPPSVGITPGFGISSLSATFDNSDNLHIVCSVSDTGYTLPAEIWHYCPTNPQPWTLVHHYDADTLNAAVGYNAIFATRPTIIQASSGNFYVAWEVFDSLSFEPTTSLANADIWAAELTNNGQTLTRRGRITDVNTTSKRFPCVGGVKDDTLFIQYEIDSVAGFTTQSQGRETRNPIICHRLHVNSIPIVTGIEENPGNYYKLALKPSYPNPSNFFTNISYSVPITGNVDLTIYDVLGRPIKTLVSGTKTAGEYSAIWDGRDGTGKKAQAGIYFYTLKTADKSISQKLIRTN